jgi:cardiolipin hydrolase
MTNDKLFEAVEESWNANIAVRIITDDECVKQKGSDVYKLATLGIPVKTDSNAKYHMHHKFVIVDKKVLITGSFNWTVQAVKSNNENVLMIQNEQLVKEYIREFDDLWKEFNEEITPEEAKEETKKK